MILFEALKFQSSFHSASFCIVKYQNSLLKSDTRLYLIQTMFWELKPEEWPGVEQASVGASELLLKIN
jgi:hypothetical protein